MVNNGIYTLEFQTDANKVLDLMNGTDANGTAIRPWTKNGATAQQWVAVSAGSYWRFISNASSSNRCIDLANANTSNGTSIRLWDNYSNDAQAWQVTSAGNGYYKITSKLNTSRGFDTPNCSMDGSANIQLWDYYGTSCQLYKFNYVGMKSAEIPFGDNAGAASFEIYPNPSADGYFTIAIPGISGSENVQLSIYSTEGKRVFDQKNLTTGENYINSKLTKGIYIVKAICNNSIWTKKLIIE